MRQIYNPEGALCSVDPSQVAYLLTIGWTNDPKEAPVEKEIKDMVKEELLAFAAKKEITIPEDVKHVPDIKAFLIEATAQKA